MSNQCNRCNQYREIGVSVGVMGGWLCDECSRIGIAPSGQRHGDTITKLQAELTALRAVAEAAEKFQNKAGPVADYGNDFIEADRNLMNALAEWRRSK